MDTRIGKETTLFLQSLALPFLPSPSANKDIMPTYLSSVIVFLVTVDFVYICQQWGWWSDPIATTTKNPGLLFLFLFYEARFTDRTSAVGGREGTKTVSEKSAEID
jgi:hypothetical protein